MLSTSRPSLHPFIQVVTAGFRPDNASPSPHPITVAHQSGQFEGFADTVVRYNTIRVAKHRPPIS